MGVRGCGRVRKGTGDTGGTTTSQAGGVYGRGGQYLGAMAGEISPDMMFFGVCQKCSNMGADGRRWMRMGAIGCVSTGMHKNKAKRVPNGRAGHIFERMVKCKKCNM